MTDAHIAPPLVLVDEAAGAALEDWGPLEEATGPAMTASGLMSWSHDGSEMGIWECTPGPSHWVQEQNEFIHVLSGSMTVTPTDGEAVEIGPGDSALFPAGWTGTWEIHETLRKVYVIFL